MADKNLVLGLLIFKPLGITINMEIYAQAHFDNLGIAAIRMDSVHGEVGYLQFFDLSMEMPRASFFGSALSSKMIAILKSNSRPPETPEENIDVIAGLLAHDDFRKELRETKGGCPDLVLNLIKMIEANDERNDIYNGTTKATDSDPMGKAL